MTITAIVRLDAKPESMEQLSAKMREAIVHARANPECHAVEATSATDGAPIVYLDERWTSQAALDAHAGSGYMLDLLATLPEWLTKAPEVVIAKSLEG